MRDYVVLDVFTRVPLQGNPVAVFLDGEGLSADVMQRTARELNLSETVFLFGDRVRIFTPAAELPFAGHPVLGTAFVVGGQTGDETVVLHTGAGPVPIKLTRDGEEIVFGEMAQPIPSREEFAGEAELFDALGIPGSEVPLGAWRNGPLHLYVQLADRDAVDALSPDVGALARILPGGVSCYALVGPASVHSRVFVPALGVPEDPATGSAAGPLAVHLATHGVVDWGAEVQIAQGVAMGRPSELRARAIGTSSQIERVLVGGGAVVVAQGRYRLG